MISASGLDGSATEAAPRRAKPFIAQALAAAEKAGGLARRSGRKREWHRFRPRPGGELRGRAASDRSDPQRCRQGTRRAARDEADTTQRTSGLPAQGGRDQRRDQGPNVRRRTSTTPIIALSLVAVKKIATISGLSWPQRMRSQLSDLKAFTRDLMAAGRAGSRHEA